MVAVLKNIDIEYHLLLLLSLLFFTTFFCSSVDNTGAVIANYTRFTYGCVLGGITFHCDLMPNSFTSMAATGKARKIYEVDSPLQIVQGKFQNGMGLQGYIGQYLTIPNNISLNPPVFSISFWMKQNPDFGLDGSVLSHVNAERTAGWFFEAKVQPGPKIQFSVVNSAGKVFTTESSVRKDEFENVVGSFDGNLVKLYLNGVLKDSIPFSGSYQPDPAVPLNVGLDSYDLDKSWEGVIDDILFSKRPLSQAEVKDIFDGVHNLFSDLVGYWTFDNDTKDLSQSRNDGRIVSQAVSMAFVPDGRLFFTEKNTGKIRIMDKNHVFSEPFAKIKNLYVAQHQGLLGITVDPKFDLNHFIYAFYTWKDNQTGNIFNRVSRFTEFKNTAMDEKVLLDNIPASPEGEFAGGALAFGPDDKLYITSGHANSYVLPQNKSSLIGKVLRINRDGSIPTDNPYPKSPVFTLGHRNSFGIAFDKNGDGIITENGDAHYDEVNLLRKGGNYGFPATQPPGKSPQLDNTSSIKPIRSYWIDIAPTQAIFYNGDKFQSLKSKFIFGSYNEGSIYALGLNQSNAVKDETTIYFPEIIENIISLAQSPTGKVYFGGYNIYELTSIEPIEDGEHQMYFLDLGVYHTKIGDVIFDPSGTSLKLSVTTDLDKGDHAPFVNVKIPKSLLKGIFQVSSSAANRNETDDSIIDFNIKEQYRTADIGSTIVHIDLNTGRKSNIIIKGIKQTPNN